MEAKETEKAKAKNLCHQMEIWKQLIDTEMKTAANWEGQWGFLKGQVPAVPAGAEGAGESRKVTRSSSTPSLPKDKAMEYFTGTRARAKLDRAEALMQRKTLTPQERYSSMRITSHEIGWRPSIERPKRRGAEVPWGRFASAQPSEHLYLLADLPVFLHLALFREYGVFGAPGDWRLVAAKSLGGVSQISLLAGRSSALADCMDCGEGWRTMAGEAVNLARASELHPAAGFQGGPPQYLQGAARGPSGGPPPLRPLVAPGVGGGGPVGPGLLGLGAPSGPGRVLPGPPPVPGPPPMQGLRPGLGLQLPPGVTAPGSFLGLGAPDSGISRSLEQMRAEVNRVEQVCKQHAAEAKAYVGVVARLIKSSAALIGAIQAQELPTNVQILKDQLGSMKIGDSVVFKVAQNQLGIPQVSFARKLEALTQERQRLMEVEAPLPAPGTPESDVEYLGFVTSFQPELGFGFLSCAQTRQLYGQEVVIHRDQFTDLNVSDGVHFKVALNAKHQPIARKVRKAGGDSQSRVQPAAEGRSERSRSRSASISSPRRSRSRRRDRDRRRSGSRRR
ncbi:unnamed protein product [Symbiodinium sp. CCMP2456]|nr:unnamed protein product [Symbiodinium sp. CCMP2456]